MACTHETATTEGCALCNLIAQVRRKGIVHAPGYRVALACEYCGELVIFVGTGPTVFHIKPECAAYLAADLGGYIDRVRARVRAKEAS